MVCNKKIGVNREQNIPSNTNGIMWTTFGSNHLCLYGLNTVVLQSCMVFSGMVDRFGFSNPSITLFQYLFCDYHSLNLFCVH